jgi:hypothetical protein
MNGFGERMQARARGRAGTSRFIFYCSILMCSAGICLLRGFPEGFSAKPRGSGAVATGATQESSVGQSLELPVDAAANGADAALTDTAPSLRPVKIENVAPDAIPPAPIDETAQNAPENMPPESENGSPPGAAINFSPADAGAVGFEQDFDSGLSLDMSSSLGPNPGFGPLQSVPEPDTVALAGLGGLITAWWTVRLIKAKL